MALRQHLAQLIRRIPKLMVVVYYIYRFFQPKYSVGVVGVVINPKHEILLVEHVFHPKLPWGLPGGWINFNEDPSVAAMREIREELGLETREIEHLLTLRTDFNHLDIAYLCKVDDFDIDTISYELLNYRWCSQEDLPPLHNFHKKAVEKAFSQIETPAPIVAESS